MFEAVRGRLFPVLGLNDEVIVATNFGTDLEKPFKWTPDTQMEKANANGVSGKNANGLMNEV